MNLKKLFLTWEVIRDVVKILALKMRMEKDIVNLETIFGEITFDLSVFCHNSDTCKLHTSQLSQQTTQHTHKIC